jgi:SP family general alpha glucoside:H+ symporter-like MFS transporter
MASETRQEKQGGADQIETGGSYDLTALSTAGLHDKVLNSEARQATATEHSLTLWQALKTYRKAAFWSIRMRPLLRLPPP